MELPRNHVAEYNGDLCNWCVGEAARNHPDDYHWDRITYWVFGVPQNTKGGKWNSINAKYCGKFNNKTRIISEIIELKK